MLSLQKGKKRLCTQCFETQDIHAKDLDSHDHDPFSPGVFEPYHPFTKRYACAKNLMAEDDPDSNWSDDQKDGQDGQALAKTRKKQIKRKRKTKKKQNATSGGGGGDGSNKKVKRKRKTKKKLNVTSGGGGL